MKRYSAQHYPDPTKPPDGGDDRRRDGSKKCKTQQSFESLFDNESLSDVIFNINEGQLVFQGHKMIVGIKSDILATMIKDLVVEDSQKPVLYLQESPDCTLIFSRFLFFIYSGAVWLHRDYVLPLYKLAVKYGVKSLVQHCEDYIKQILSDTGRPTGPSVGSDTERVTWTSVGFSLEVVCDIYENNSQTVDIKNASFKVLCSRFQELTKSARWPLCPWDMVYDLLETDGCLADENLILTAATDWMKKNNLHDKSQIEQVLTRIRYPLLHRRVLYHLQKNGAFNNFPQVQSLVNNAVRYHCFHDIPEARSEFVGVQYQQRKKPSLPSQTISSEGATREPTPDPQLMAAASAQHSSSTLYNNS